MKENALKLAAGTILVAVWAYLVTIGKAEAPALVDFIKVTLAWLMAHAIFKGNPKP